MKSTIIKLYDYKQAVIPAEWGLWRITDGEVAEKLETLSHNHAIETEPDTVERFDSVACSGKSEAARWNRKSLRFYPGRKLCDADIENALIGAKIGESRTVRTEEGEITLTVTRIVRRRSMPVGDELVKAEGIDGVTTVADYYRWYREQNEPERRMNACMRTAYQLIHQIAENSEYSFDEGEKRTFVSDRVDRIYQAMVMAGADPTIPKEGFDFLTEEQAKANMYDQFEPTFSAYVACGYLVKTLGGVDDLDAFCEAGLERLAADLNLSVDTLLENNGEAMCYDKLLQDKALELLAVYTEQFLED